jgi:hypothetical protein
MSTTPAPIRATRLEIGPPFSTARQFPDLFRSAVEKAVGELLASLGIPAAGCVRIALAASELEGEALTLEIGVGGAAAGYSAELVRSLYGYIGGKLGDSQQHLTAIADWLKDAALNQPAAAADFLALLCVEVLKRQPEILLPDEAVEAYAGLIAATEARPALSSAWLASVLRPVVKLGISIGNVEAIAAFLQKQTGLPPEDAAEELIDSLAARTVEIRSPHAYLVSLTSGTASLYESYFGWLRNGLFQELGLTFPPFRFVCDESARAGSFAFKINDLASEPFVALGNGQCLVNDSPDRLAASGFQGRPASIPISGLPASTVDAALRDALAKSGYTIWDPMGYLILCLAQVIRMRAGSFVRLGTVGDSVRQLKSKFPLAVEAALAQADLYSLTRILRGMVDSSVPIRDLQSIVERIADREYCATDAAALTVLAEGYPALASQEGLAPLETWLSFVKRGLARPAPAP